MKTIRILTFSLIFVMTIKNVQAQDSTQTKIIGTWFLFHTSSDTLTFSRINPAPHNWGQRIEFYKNGNYADAYSAKCGNDSNIHSDKGSWTYNNSTQILETTIPIALMSKKYKVLILATGKLILFRQ